MTREEAIEVIKAYKDKLTNSASNQLDGDIEALDMAIKALEQEPTTERIEYGTDGNPYKLTISNGKEFEQEPCDDCCNGNQIEKAKLCQKSYIAGMEHKQELKTDVLDKIKADVEHIEVCPDGYSAYIRSGEQIKNIVIEIIDNYMEDMVQ